jgi:uncharacterized protein (TIGR02271 family)
MDDVSDSRPAGAGALYDETILANAEIIKGQRVVLHAEQPAVEKRNVRDSLAIVTRRPVVVRKTIEIDVMHEEIQVEYRQGDGSEMFGAEPQTYTILLHAEEVQIVKRVRVVEEVILSKKRVVERKRLSVTLRHEHLDLLEDPSVSAARNRA